MKWIIRKKGVKIYVYLLQMEFIKWFSKSKKIKNIGFEDMKYAIKNKQMIINTLTQFEQECLIYGTISYDKEEAMVNSLIEALTDRDKVL